MTASSATRAAQRRPRRPSSAHQPDATEAEAPWSVIEGRTTLAEQIYVAVRERILSGKLAPSTMVRERQIEQMMGVSRTPVREALRRLASEGFLDPAPQQGYLVPDMSVDDLVDLYPAVQLLEVLAFDLAIDKISHGDLDELADLNAEFSGAITDGDVPAAVDANNRFHEQFAGLCGNRPLCRLLEDLRLRVRRLEMLDFSDLLSSPKRRDGKAKPSSRSVWVKQHEEILAALRRGKHDTARELLRKNRSLLLRDKSCRRRDGTSEKGATRPGVRSSAGRRTR